MDNKNNKVACVFPGQGSQSVGMLKELALVYPVVKEVFEQASDSLALDLWKISQNDAESLNETQYTQPAMLAAGIAVWKVWCQQSAVRPDWVAGHSLGEYTALVVAEALDFATAIKLVTLRGQLMQAAVPANVGAMAAVLGLDDEAVVAVCQQIAQAENAIVSAVNFNAPGQVVIAGETAAVEIAMLKLKTAGARRLLKLPVSVPSHCALMQPAAEKLALALQTVALQLPKIQLVHNVDVSVHTELDGVRAALTTQLYKPVRWVESVKFMHLQGVQHFIEFGPGKVLWGLNKRIVKAASHNTIYDPKSLDKVLEELNG